MSAQAAPGDISAQAATVINKYLLIESPPSYHRPQAGLPPDASNPPEDAERVNKREAKSPPKVRADEPEPSQMNEGASEQPNEQPVASRRIQAKNPVARTAAGRGTFPERHRYEQRRDHDEKRGGLPCPRHPGQVEDGMGHRTLCPGAATAPPPPCAEGLGEGFSA